MSKSAASFIPDPRELVGTFRRFGPFGPAYEIIEVGSEEPLGDRWMRVRVIESGEIVDYKFSNVLGLKLNQLLDWSGVAVIQTSHRRTNHGGRVLAE